LQAASYPLLQLGNGRVRLEASGATDVGRRRAHNEDILGLLPEAYRAIADQRGYLFAVADGMGGMEKGEVASRVAVDALFATYYDSSPESAPDLPPAAALLAGFNAANAAVYQESCALAAGAMGTTLVACVILDGMAIVGNVGDSRAYLLRGGDLVQITHDHSLVADQVRDGIMTPAEARVSPYRNIITRAVGHEPQVVCDRFQVGPLQPRDLFLLCSDGLHGMLEDDELLRLAQQDDLRQIVHDYIAAANARGGVDNITCLLVRVLAVPGPAPA
jgi:protein phosphatase